MHPIVLSPSKMFNMQFKTQSNQSKKPNLYKSYIQPSLHKSNKQSFDTFFSSYENSLRTNLKPNCYSLTFVTFEKEVFKLVFLTLEQVA